ncbi:hypothetical protein GE061_009430 [Apolygus lucorum]|uniref:Uncharacterized protein n=1 Tax=Apolygus lucorum TaxID=248454 RepID=A0A8S9Y0H8_APOLU|nr:hypothetical protein GE061_009430 [Apolygus lucorum]
MLPSSMAERVVTFSQYAAHLLVKYEERPQFQKHEVHRPRVRQFQTNVSSVHKMKLMIAAFVGVALIASSLAFPLGSGLGTGLTSKNGLSSLYSTEMMVGGRPVMIGLSWAKDGTVAAGAQVNADINGQNTPIGASISSNINDLGKEINYEVGAQVLDTVAGIVSGDLKGDLKYLVNAWVPIKNAGEVTAVGVGIEGAQLKPVAISGGVGVAGDIIGARVGLDSDLKPDSVNVIVGA